MRVVAPQSFTYVGGDRAVLLLHGFTGSPLHVRKLGRYLHERGFTCHAPLYKGHGLDPQELINTGPVDWWQNVLDGYDFLKEKGYTEIAVAGVSLGGVFALKVGMELPVKGIVSMCSPIKEKSIFDLFQRVLHYAKSYKKFEGKRDEELKEEMRAFEDIPMPSLKDLQQLILETGRKIDRITSPIFVLQGCLDEPLYLESAQKLYDNVMSTDKQLKWYEHSAHIITLDQEQDQVYEDVFTFLNQLDW